MAELTVYTSSSDGSIKAWAASFQSAHDAATGTITDSAIGVGLGLVEPGTNVWYIDRTFLFFDDTSLLPDDATITGAILSIYLGLKQITAGEDFDCVIQNGQPDYPNDSLEAGDYLHSHYSGDGGSKNTSVMTNYAYNNITLNATGRGWISKTGATKLCLRSSADIDETGIGTNKIAKLEIYQVERGSAYRAKLVITYYAPSTVTTQAVSNVGVTTLTGNGNITDIGSENATRRGFCYMEGISGDPTTSDSVAYDDGSFGTGAYTKGIIGLSASTNYRVRAYAVNEAGTSYGSTVQTTTLDIPTVTVTTQAVSNIGITTAIGHGNITFGVATIRGICWNTTGNPTVADYKSEEVGSFGTGAFTSPMTSLSEEQEYYVRAYAYDDNGYSYGSQVEFTTYATFSVRGFEVRLAFTGTLNEYIDHEIAGFSTGTASYNADTSKWEGTITKTVIEIGSFSEGAFTGDLGRFPIAVASDKLFAGETYDYRAYVIIYGITFYGNYVEFTTNTHPADYILDDISDGNFIVPIIPIEFYYKKPYTKKDVSELRKKCIIFNENSVGLALVLRHNMNVLREFFNMTTDYIDEFNRYKDVIPTQHLKELYLESLELNNFKDIVNSFIVNSADNNMNVNHNFNLIQEGLSDYETGSDDAYFRGINSNVKSVIEDNPDVNRLENKIDELNNESTTNFTTIMHNLKIIRARLL